MNKLFQKFLIAAKAMQLCAEPAKSSPIAKSEVLNETWMLRLTLAFIHDYEGDFDCRNQKKTQLLNDIRKAVRLHWISEGGLEPVFAHEGPTWTDAILGSVVLSDVSKRGVSLLPKDKDDFGVVVVEAKLGSKLSPGITNSTDYDQAARNIACLSKLLTKRGSLAKKSAFCVFAPRAEDVDSAQDYINSALEIIKRQDKDRMGNKARDRKNVDANFDEIVKTIQQRSMAISWNEVIDSMGEAPEAAELRAFYNSALNEMKIGGGNA